MSANARLKLGIAFVVFGNLLFFTSAWIAWMPWPASFKAMLWSALFFAPETGTIIGVALMGRVNYERFKDAVLKRWRKKTAESPAEVANSDADSADTAEKPDEITEHQ